MLFLSQNFARCSAQQHNTYCLYFVQCKAREQRAHLLFFHFQCVAFSDDSFYAERFFFPYFLSFLFLPFWQLKKKEEELCRRFSLSLFVRVSARATFFFDHRGAANAGIFWSSFIIIFIVFYSIAFFSFHISFSIRAIFFFLFFFGFCWIEAAAAAATAAEMQFTVEK